MGGSNPGNAILLNGAFAADTANRETGAPTKTGLPGHPLWHSRGYLPHFEGSEVTQHVTFHLADSLPQQTIEALEQKLKFLPDNKRDAERRKCLDAYMDAGHGSCILRKPEIANMVQESLLTFDAQRYRLLAWVVMPNHVHVLFVPCDGWSVAKIVASWKKFTARQILSARSDVQAPVWHREYWDRYIRNQAHLEKAVEYIHSNPVKAGLVKRAEEWRWGSACRIERQDANREIGAPRKA